MGVLWKVELLGCRVYLIYFTGNFSIAIEIDLRIHISTSSTAVCEGSCCSISDMFSSFNVYQSKITSDCRFKLRYPDSSGGCV